MLVCEIVYRLAGNAENPFRSPVEKPYQSADAGQREEDGERAKYISRNILSIILFENAEIHSGKKKKMGTVY